MLCACAGHPMDWTPVDVVRDARIGGCRHRTDSLHCSALQWHPPTT